MTETITRFNGNGQEYTVGLPKIVIIGFVNDGALKHILENTGLEFVKDQWKTYSVIPRTSNQIVTLFMTYNFKTIYYDNHNEKNTLFLKNDHHIGFDVDHICFECCKENRITTKGLKKTERLKC